jgi:hypothetical protein
MRVHNLVFVIASALLTAGQSQAAEPVPHTMDQAYSALDRLLSPSERSQFAGQPEQQAVTDAHFGLGMHMRNEWFRSGGSSLVGTLHKLGARHFDDMSSMVLTSYWRHLNGKPVELENQGACYRRWWEEQTRIIKAANARREDSHGTPSFSCPGG